MKENFENALKVVLGFEGKYVNDPADPGGATNYGITDRVYREYQKKVYPDYRPLCSVKDIGSDEVADIYRNNYWLPAACDRLPDKLDLFHFDTAVNCGVKTAGRLLQKAINFVCWTKCLSALPEDGAIGPKTLERISSLPVKEIIKAYRTVRVSYYSDIIEKNQKLEKFRKGWLNRVDKLCKSLDIAN